MKETIEDDTATADSEQPQDKKKARQGQLCQSQGHSLNTARLPFAIKSSCTPLGNIMHSAFHF